MNFPAKDLSLQHISQSYQGLLQHYDEYVLDGLGNVVFFVGPSGSNIESSSYSSVSQFSATSSLAFFADVAETASYSILSELSVVALTASYVDRENVVINTETVTSSVTLTELNRVVQNITVLTANIDVQLPPVATAHEFILKKSDPSGYRARIKANPGEKIDGYATQSLTSYGDALHILPEKTSNNWIII